MSHPRLGAILRLWIALLLYLVGSAIVTDWRQQASIDLAVAKGQQMYLPELEPLSAIQPAVLDSWPTAELAPLVFIDALPLSAGEARPWSDAGCRENTCAHVFYYDRGDGRLVNQIVSLTKNEILAEWRDELSRPPGSPHIAREALAIAASDPAVTAVLGGIGDGEPAMVPMSAWLADDACQQDWCVDLTFHSPSGDGRIFHVFVNMRQKTVARTFYSRARANLDVALPVAQRQAFSNGCHEQDGWNVCWEMTAHDGLLFSDGRYNDAPIFSSIKITQIEAWYPSWPGGYRDEVGFSSTVPPFGGTLVNELEDGFEVRQMFTEFTRWPNCICCYRYEQIVRFFADGSFEPRFISHGPGCDDLSIYRPFWRIDVEQESPESGQVWLWQENEWTEVNTEIELYPFIDDSGPEGFKMVSGSSGQLYGWGMLPTDPLGLDEARLFVLKENELEGEQPLTPGPGDTFQPPRQWLNEEVIAGEDLVIWFVPLLKTKKTEPIWCQPDPEPGINQCEAILRVERIEELPQPPPEEPAITETTTPSVAEETAVPPAATPSPRPIQGNSVEEIIMNAGCGSCHAIGPIGEGHKVGPDLSLIGYEATGRIPGMTAADYLRQSILEPNAALAPVCPNGDCLANIMPQDYGQRLTRAQIELIINYLLALDGTQSSGNISVIGEGAQGDFPKGGAADKANRPIIGDVDPSAASVQLIMVGIVFLLTLFLLWKRPYEE